MSAKSKISKIFSVITTVFVALVVLVALFLMGSRIAGFRVFNVISGSMEPAYSVGDLLYVKAVDPAEIRVGDPITFVLNEDLVVATHRVIEIDADSKHFYTQGDANDTPDASPVHFNNLIGKPVFALPFLGYVSDYIQNPPGTYVAIGVMIVLLAAVFLPDLIKKKKNADDIPSAELSREREELDRMKKELEAARAELEKANSAEDR